MKTLILILTLATMAVGQDTTKLTSSSMRLGYTDSSYISESYYSFNNNATKEIARIYHIPKKRIQIYDTLQFIDFIDSVFRVSSEAYFLRQKNAYLEKIVRIYAQESIEMDKAFLKSGLVDSATIKRSTKLNKEILKGLRK